MADDVIVTDPVEGEKEKVVETKVETKVEPKTEEKVVSKEKFDKTASELAELKRQLKSKMTEDEKNEAEKLEAQVKAQEEKERIENELNELKKEVETSKLISSTSSVRTKIDFSEDSEELKAVIENLNFTTLSNLINKIGDIAYEKGKKDVTDGVMNKTGSLNLAGASNVKLNPELEEAKLIAQSSKGKVKTNPYFSN